MGNFQGIKSRIRTDYIIVHCSATTDKQDIGVAEIDRWHRARGWAGIGYHYVIRRDGTVETGRPENMIGAHCEGYNHLSVGICLAGGVDANDIDKAEDNFTCEQKVSLRNLIRKLQKVYPKAKLRGHRDMPNVTKACPSFDVQGWFSGSN